MADLSAVAHRNLSASQFTPERREADEQHPTVPRREPPVPFQQRHYHPEPAHRVPGF